MPDLLALGECMVELYADQPLAEAATFVKTFGGDTCNVLVAAARLGTSTGFITRVADDPFGPFLLRSWQDEGIDIQFVRRVPGFNGLYLISLLPDGEREFEYYRKGSAASTLESSDLDEQGIGAAKILHVSGISQALSPSCRQAVLAAAKLAKQHGVRVSFDPNLRTRLWSPTEARQAMEELLPFVDVVLPSAPEESRLLIGESDPLRVAEWFRATGASTVAVKCGASGALVSSGAEVATVPAHVPARVLDSSGAGDVFAGAFLHGIIAGMPAITAARLGVVAAGLKIQGRGAIASQPRREDINLYVELANG